MTYCEAAQKDCPYLEDAQSLRADFLLMRATGFGEDEIDGSIAERVVEEIIDEQISRCNEAYCALQGLAVQHAIAAEAKQKLEE